MIIGDIKVPGSDIPIPDPSSKTKATVDPVITPKAGAEPIVGSEHKKVVRDVVHTLPIMKMFEYYQKATYKNDLFEKFK